jgi:dihydrofolate reductase
LKASQGKQVRETKSVRAAFKTKSERIQKESVMRKIIVLEYVSLDGVIEAPGGQNKNDGPPWWITMHSDTVSQTAVMKLMSKPFDLLLGRKTFEAWAQFWPQHNDMWPAVNSATKYVASNNLTSHEWQPSVFLGGDIAEQITRIKQTEGPDLHVAGSANLVQTLLKHDLVDALTLMIFPITLGGDKRLFVDGAIQAAFNVTDSVVTPKGVIIVTYERAREVQTPGL